MLCTLITLTSGIRIMLIKLYFSRRNWFRFTSDVTNDVWSTTGVSIVDSRYFHVIQVEVIFITTTQGYRHAK